MPCRAEVRHRALAISLSAGFAVFAAGAWNSCEAPEVERSTIPRRARAPERPLPRGGWSPSAWVAPADAGAAASSPSEPWEDDAGVEPSRADLVEALCRPLAISLCAARARCGCESTPGCVATELQSCESWLRCAYPERGPESVVDAGRAQACVGSIAAQHAHCLAPSPAEECYGVLVAPVEPGEACGEDDYDCLGGRCVEGRCERIPRAGEACDDECADGAFCDDDGRCRSFRGLECSDPADCGGGLACVSGRCGPPRREGEPCDDAGACAPRLSCEGGRCARVLECERHLTCLEGDECTGEHSRRCVPAAAWPLGELGDPCTWETCAEGLACRGGRCADAAELGEPCEGACGRGLACLVGRCVPSDLPLDQACTSYPDRCAPGLACHYTEGGPRCRPARGLNEGCEAHPCERGLRCEEVFEDGRCAPALCDGEFADPWGCDVD